MTTNENAKQVGGNTVLVTAASGKTGRRVADRLTARGVDVRAGSRKGEVRFDWEDEGSWGPALAGADAAYVAYYPDLAAPGAVEAMRAFGLAARERGVSRLVLLSGRGEPDAALAESALREACGSPSALTVVRAAFFAQNFSEGAMAEGVAAGEIAFPGGDTAEPWVDADDLADVVVEALVSPGHGGETYEVTGPRLLTFAEVAEEIGRATGREVRYVPVTVAQYAAALQGYGLPMEEAEWMAGLFGMLLDGHNAMTTDTVRRVLGREARDFRGFAEGVWRG
ncbi:NmrA family transcriptional regulator [Streptomyces sp. NBC_00237]|uniref:NmrA family NAD(P)-binding protein n=1 Tax=Streptomyces sp. NBC_00237 TaxID=2975687 RepID=UPI00224F86F5|nr:NmrA family transcriptional regulator [Streptomyces sp. NBC_00237]MCX5203024.1 NmrA family transcriptional regulator [Streptomyces sp. NBC_00237]